jgi:hypothetical protein
MAWQVLLLKLPDALGSLSALPADYVPPALGEPEHVAQRITEAASGKDLDVDSDGARLVVMRNDDFVIEAELGGTAAIDRVLLRVLGSEAALPLVGELARKLETAAVDCETDAVLDIDAIAPDSLRQWQNRIDDLS